MRKAVVFAVIFFMMVTFITAERNCARIYGQDSIFDMSIKKNGSTIVLSF